eukprot:scaffold40473_cov39-Attheya_sp.AAC.1
MNTRGKSQDTDRPSRQAGASTTKMVKAAQKAAKKATQKAAKKAAQKKTADEKNKKAADDAAREAATKTVVEKEAEENIASTKDGPIATPTASDNAQTKDADDAMKKAAEAATKTVVEKEAEENNASTKDGPDATPTASNNAQRKDADDATKKAAEAATKTIVEKEAEENNASTRKDGPDATPTASDNVQTKDADDAMKKAAEAAATKDGPDAIPAASDNTTQDAPDATSQATHNAKDKNADDAMKKTSVAATKTAAEEEAKKDDAATMDVNDDQQQKAYVEGDAEDEQQDTEDVSKTEKDERDKSNTIISPPRMNRANPEELSPVRQFFTNQENELFVQSIVSESNERSGIDLHNHVLGLDFEATEEDVKKAYRILILCCHPDKINHPDATAAFCIITTAKEEIEERVKQIAEDIRDFGLGKTAEKWEAEDRAEAEQDEYMREYVNKFQKAQEARRQAAEDEVKEKARAKHRQRQADYLTSDSSSGSDNDSNKSMPEKANAYDTAHEPQKESMGSFVSKNHTIATIKDLHRQCHFYDTEHMFMLPMTWLKVQRTFPNEEVRSEITDTTSCRPSLPILSFLLRIILKIGIQKFMVPGHVFKVFILLHLHFSPVI